jgi:radical SAM protein with 4Fe4S-binding SPASM domain
MGTYDLYLQRFFADREPGDFPFRLGVEATNHCNLRCGFCPREDSDRGFGFMDFELFASLARQAAGKEIIFYPQGFGESFLHPRFREMLLELNRAGVICPNVITNATLLDERNCHALMDASTTVVTLSIDGADPTTYESLRVNASYDQVVENVLRLLRIREERRSRFPFVMLSVVGTPEVRATLPAFRAFWEPKLRETDDIFIGSPLTWAGDVRPSGREGARPPDDHATRPPCRMLYKTLQVYYDGRATPCCYDHACALEVGNVRTDSVEEIWRGEPLRRLRELHEQGRSAEIPLCKGCPDHTP